jgi:arylamine N-acetyltransferase
LDNIKVDFLNGVGGVCYNLNMSACFLLQAVGFKSSIALATCTTQVDSFNNHVVVYVEDVEKAGDKFLVEVGLGFPTFRAVSLDFETESQQVRESFQDYKYIKHGGKIMRMHNERDPTKRQTHNSYEEMNFVIGGWKRFYYANPEGCTNIEELYPHFDTVR